MTIKKLERWSATIAPDGVAMRAVVDGRYNFLFRRTNGEQLVEQLEALAEQVPLDTAPLQRGGRTIALAPSRLDALRARLVLDHLATCEANAHQRDIAGIFAFAKPQRFVIQACQRAARLDEEDAVALAAHLLRTTEDKIRSLIEYDAFMAKHR